jgi:hypothetical protein
MSQELENIDIIEEDPATEENKEDSEDSNLLTIHGNVISEYIDSLFQQKMKSITDDIKNQITASQKITNEERESFKGEIIRVLDEKLKEDRKRVDNIIATINKLAVAIRKQNEFLLKMRTENNRKITEMESLINSSLEQKVCVIPSTQTTNQTTNSENIVVDKKQVMKPKKK